MHRFLLAFTFSLVVALSAVSTTAGSANSGLVVPTAFEVNMGQVIDTDGERVPHVNAFLSTPGVSAFLHPRGMHVVLQRLHNTDSDTGMTMDLYRVDMDLIGSNPMARLEYERVGVGTTRYIGPGDSAEGRISQRWEVITYHDVYPGIDMRLTASKQGPKIDFIVHPGADANRIAFEYNGASGLFGNNEGGLTANTPLGLLREQAPVSWTELNGRRTQQIASSFVINGTSVRFKLDDYDHTETLVIDPQRIWATYYTGNSTFSAPFVGMDKFGNVYMASQTSTTNMPKINGVFQKNLKARTDAYVAKFNDAGAFIWHTYAGGSGSEVVNDSYTTPEGDTWIVGGCDNRDTPLYALDPAGSGPIGGLEDDTLTLTPFGWTMRVTPAGAWGDSWLLDSDGYDVITGIAHRNNKLALIGWTRSRKLVNGVTGNPVKRDTTNNYNNKDAFICRMSLRTGTPDRWNADWFTYYGGGSDDEGYRIDLDNNGNVGAVGWTMSTNFPVTDGGLIGGSYDSWAVKISAPTPTAPVISYATFIGGSANDVVINCVMDSQGNFITVGKTLSANFPLRNAYRNTRGGQEDGFIRKLATNGTAIFSTYFGGDGLEQINGVAVDKNDRIWIGMQLNGADDMPVTANAYQSQNHTDDEYPDLNEGYFAQLSSDGGTLLYGTFYGAAAQDNLPDPPPDPPGMPPPPPPPPDTDWGDDYISDIWVDQNAYVVLGSYMKSYRMDTTSGAFQDSSDMRKDTIQASSFLTFFSNCTDSNITTIVNGKTTLCPNETRQLMAPTGFAKYYWSRGDTTRIINATDSGRYIVTCVNSDGCKYRDTVVLTRNPNPTVTAGADVSGCVNTPIQLHAEPSGGTPPYAYKWKRVEAGPSGIDNDAIQDPKVSPTSTSRYQITLTDSAGCTALDTVQVTIINPKPTVSPASADFGSLGACESAKEIEITLKNPESYAVAINEFQSNWAIIGLVTPISPPLNVPAKDSVKLRLRVSPSAPGTTNGTFVIKGTPCAWTVNVPFTVTRQQLLASVSPTSVNFGTAPDCQTINKDTTVVIRNGSPDNMVLSAAVVGAPFTATLSSINIAPNDSATVTVNYTPVANGTFIDVVRIPFAAGACNDTLKIDVRGGRFNVSVTSTPTTIDFGTLTGCETERDTVVTIYNTSSVPLTADLQSTAEVIFSPSGSVGIPANDSVQVTITIRPAAPGAFSANVSVPVEPCGLSVTYALSAVQSTISINAPASVDFGEIVTCRDGSSKTESFTIQYDGTGTSTVSSVVTGSQISTTLASGITFSPGVPQTFDVRWNTVADGALVDSIVVVFEPCAIRRVIALTGVRTTPEITSAIPVITVTNAPAVMSGTLEFINTGTDTFRVSITVQTPDVSVSNQVPPPTADILPGERVSIDFILRCNGRDSYTDLVRADVTTPCPLTASTEFNGTCAKAAAASATVKIDTALVNVGTRFKLPLLLTSSTGLDAAGLRNWRAEITYDPMVMVGMGNTPDCYVDGVYTPCTITVQGTRTDTVGTLFDLDFTAVLGPRAMGNVELSSFIWLDDTTMSTQTINGYVRIADICEEGGTRLLDPKSNTFSINIFPNPASTQFTIRVLGLGQQAGSWRLHNYVGSQIANGPLTPDTQGNAEVVVPVDLYGSGTYFVTIDARGSVYRTPLVIVH